MSCWVSQDASVNLIQLSNFLSNQSPPILHFLSTRPPLLLGGSLLISVLRWWGQHLASAGPRDKEGARQGEARAGHSSPPQGCPCQRLSRQGERPGTESHLATAQHPNKGPPWGEVSRPAPAPARWLKRGSEASCLPGRRGWRLPRRQCGFPELHQAP